MAPLRVLIADDHTLFRRGLASLLSETPGFVVVGEVSSGPEAVRLAVERQPDVVLMDVYMPGGGGLAAVRHMREVLPDVPVLMLTVSENDADLLEAIRAGARGYLLKNAEPEELYSALRQVSAGRAVLDASLTDQVFRHLATSPAPGPGSDTPLSAREIEILQLVAEGRTNREIAAQLCISDNTVKTHLARIFEKLNTATREEAVALAWARGWLSPRAGG